MKKVGQFTIKKAKLEAIIGILPHEREKAQPLEYTLSYQVDFSQTQADAGQITRGVDYAELKDHIDQLIQSRCFFLLEDLVLEVTRDVLETYTDILHLEIHALKPLALEGCEGIQAYYSESR